MKQMQVLFSGRVQGVGFRYTVCRMAESFRVTGFVRNLMGGDVEVVAEGVEQELLGFLNEIRGSHLGRHIVRERLSWAAATGEYEEFRVTY
ncbi:MAG: acylphosphatase [Verrucomicrobiota bacterium]